MSREASNLSQASSEKGEKVEKQPLKEVSPPVEKSPEKPESVMDKVKKLQEVRDRLLRLLSLGFHVEGRRLQSSSLFFHRKRCSDH